MPKTTVDSESTAADAETKTLLHTHRLLHDRFTALEEAYAAYRAEGGGTAEQKKSVALRLRHAFFVTLDSVQNATDLLSNAETKAESQRLVQNFRKSVAARTDALDNNGFANTKPTVAVQPTGKVPAGDVGALQSQLAAKQSELSAVLQRYQQSEASHRQATETLRAEHQKELAEKTSAANALQTRLRQAEAAASRTVSAPPPVAPGDGEWRQKYAALKQAFDKTSASETNLKASYKTVVDDNRRLLAQLQSQRQN